MMIILVHDKEWNYKLAVLAESLENAKHKAYIKLRKMYDAFYLTEYDLIAEYLDCDEVVK